jgi:hypothetical protein
MKSIFKTMILTAALLPNIAKALEASKLYWYTYTLDSSGAMRGHSALKYDKKGNIKIAYRINYDANYGVFDGEYWKTQKADTGSGSDAKIAMALDGEGNPHIAMHDWRNSKIQYSHHDGKVWVHDSIPTRDPSTDFYQISMATDPKNRIHMSFTTKTHHPISALTYSMVGSDGKLTAPVFACTAGFNGKWNKLTTDKDGNPVAAFFLFDGVNLAVAYTKDGKWTHQTVDSSGGANEKGFHVDIKPDTADQFKIAYYNRTHKAIELATGTPGGTWAMEKVDTMPNYTLFSTLNPLGVDSKGNAFVAYVKAEVADGGTPVTKSTLRMAVKSEDKWTHATIDSLGVVGEYAAMDLSPDGLPAIAYYESGKGHFRLAVASLTPPPDADNNGIPDYKERSITIGVKARPRVALAMPGGRVFDLQGRLLRGKGDVRARPGEMDFSRGRLMIVAP